MNQNLSLDEVSHATSQFNSFLKLHTPRGFCQTNREGSGGATSDYKFPVRLLKEVWQNAGRFESAGLNRH